MAVRRLENAGRFLFGSGFRSSSLFPLLVIAVVVGAPVVGYVLHRHAKFHDLKQEIKGEDAGVPSGPRPGGREALVLTRSQSGGNEMPQFLSVTLLPGMGMDVLQITASLPGHGESPLLLSPTVQQMADGTAPALAGPDDTHGAVELPWGGGLEGISSILGTTMNATWQGHTIGVPTQAKTQPGLVEGGLLTYLDTDSVPVASTPFQQTATARFAGTDFDGHWLSRTETTVSVALSANTLDLTVTAKNVGDQQEPVGVGWHPRFNLGGGRQGALLRMPSGDRMELGGRYTEMPTGKIEPEGSLETEFVSHAGALPDAAVDAALVHLRGAAMDAGPTCELRDPAAGYGVRLISLSPNTREMRVYSPAGGNFVSLGAQTNLDNPFGSIWTSAEQPIAVLEPGQSLEWKVRLELFPVGAATSLR